MNWFKLYVKVVSKLGFKREPAMWNILNLKRKIDAAETKAFATELRPGRYYYNDLSTAYRGQKYTVRRLTDLDHQIHLRLYGDGTVTGHYELATHHSTEHWQGIELRKLTASEIKEIEELLQRKVIYGRGIFFLQG